MNNIIPVVLGGVSFDPHSGPVRQSYTSIGGSSVLTMSDGAGYKQTHWKKTQITTSGRGQLDPGLEQLDYSSALELWCVKVQAVGGTGLQYELPAQSRIRPDVEPWAIARIGDHWIEVPVALDDATRIATITPAPGAIVYRVCWLPRFQVLTAGVVSDYDENTGYFEWSFDARER